MLASHLAASHRAEAGGIAARLLDGLEEEQTAA
jgi:hypothetical protein